MLQSNNDGLNSEKLHLQLELNETKDLYKIYEKKTGELMQELNKITSEFQEAKRDMIGFNEVEKERNERIDKLKNELRVLKLAHEELDIKHGTLVINHEKTTE